MQQFLYAHSSGQHAGQLVEDCLTQIGNLPEEANFGFIYATDAVATELDHILLTLKRRTGVEHWIGTVGVGLSTTGQEYYDQPALAIMVAHFPETAFRTVPLQVSDIDSFIGSAGEWLKNDEFHFGILHGDPSNPEIPTLIS